MNKGNSNPEQNPTQMEQINEIMRRFDYLVQQKALVETFLFEFCKVNGIKEKELRHHLQVASCMEDNSLMAVNADDVRDVKFGVKLMVKTENGKFSAEFIPFGEYLDHTDMYPETTKLIEEMKNGGNTRGNTAVASGE